jgi:hypothetical protein
VTGAEADPAGDNIWVVEEDDCVASRWDVSVDWNFSYKGPCFGTSQTPIAGSDGLYYPLDITADNQGYMYILDQVASSPDAFAIKAFRYDDTTTTPFDGFGDSGDWDLKPIRIDGSRYNGNVVVLQSDGSNAKISVFTEDETP